MLRVRYDLDRTVRVARDVFRHRAIARAAPAPPDRPRVFFGFDRLPSRSEFSYGGVVKLQVLAEEFPNAPRDFNLVYLASSKRPLDAVRLLELARSRGAPLVWNQNGVAYPGWFGPGYEEENRVPARLFHAADHVVYQTDFCREAAETFYGPRRGPWQVLPNPVDVEVFAPAPRPADRPLTLLLGGNQYQRYRLEAALATLVEVPEARLLVTGQLSFSLDAPREARALVRARGLEGRVDFLGVYSQADAPETLRRADLLLHTKYNDPCPTVVLEAMACGLPIVYSASGGTPELVGEDAGVGVPAPLDWEHDHPPGPAELAAAVQVVASHLDEYGTAARRRALRFDARVWIERYRALFNELLNSPGYPDHLAGDGQFS